MANFERRIRSYSIDTSLIMVLCFVILLLKYGGIIHSDKLSIFLCFVVYILVMSMPYLAKNGQTFGKRIEKMQVVYNKNNEIPNPFILILREWFKLAAIILTFGAYIIVAGFIFNARSDGRTIHDFIFKTKVICLTKYITDNTDQYIKRSGSASKNLRGSTYED